MPPAGCRVGHPVCDGFLAVRRICDAEHVQLLRIQTLFRFWALTLSAMILACPCKERIVRTRRTACV
jgi:hypothetical protein